MIEVGAFEAKTHLSALLEKVRHGEEIVITKHGKAVAVLISAEQAKRSQVGTTIKELLTLRKELTLGDDSWKDLRDEGRR